MDEEKQRLQQGERGDGGQQLGGFMYPVSPESFSDICCLCRNMRGMLLLILSTRFNEILQHSDWENVLRSPDHDTISPI